MTDVLSATAILRLLDEAAAACTFPVLDNGYVYPAAARLSCLRSSTNWGLVIEVFGFSPRAGLPDTAVYTFAGELSNRNTRDHYISEDAYRAYLAANPHNELRFAYPLADGEWLDAEDPEMVAESAIAVVLRGRDTRLPAPSDYAALGIELEAAPRVRVYELCRALAAPHRDRVLATGTERREALAPDLVEVLVLGEWRHPDITSGELPSDTECFRQLAAVLATGDVGHYRGAEAPTTHWSNWPEAGTL